MALATAVTDEQGYYVTNCDVQLQIVSLTSEQSPITLITTPNIANEYEAQLNLLTPGFYQVNVSVIDPAGLEDEVSFNIEITTVPLGTEILLYTSIGFTVVVAVWLLKQGLVLFNLWQPTIVQRRPIG